jgi:CDP-6-deoxy-D-xylo-4-hexulose-3-dehydrase
LRNGLSDLEEFFDFMLPTHATGWSPKGFTWDNSGHKTVCSWFGFMIRVKPTAPFSKFEFAHHLDDHKIMNRMLFGGNLLRQPVFVQLKKDRPDAFRVVGDLIGTYPGLTREMLDYVIDAIHQFCRKK